MLLLEMVMFGLVNCVLRQTIARTCIFHVIINMVLSSVKGLTNKLDNIIDFILMFR